VKLPQVIVCAPAGWAAGLLRDQAAEARWLVRELTHPAALARLPADGRPTVVVMVIDPADPATDRLEGLADLHARMPDVAAVVLSDAKLPDDRRAAWIATVLDLGARAVLFPPYTKLVLEDLVGGVMAATVRRAVGTPPGETLTVAVPAHHPDDAPIDLAAGDYEETP